MDQNNADAQAQCEMPKYKCHKVVHALKIAKIEYHEEDVRGAGPELFGVMTPEDAGFKPFRVGPDYMHKHKPEVGGYYVVYADGYISFSPAEAFEDGYSLIGVDLGKEHKVDVDVHDHGSSQANARNTASRMAAYETKDKTQADAQVAAGQNIEAEQFEKACNQIRRDINTYKSMVCGLLEHPVFEQGDMPLPQGCVPSSRNANARNNLVLVFRHLEDARMRIGKVLQAMQGGVSILDKMDTNAILEADRKEHPMQTLKIPEEIKDVAKKLKDVVVDPKLRDEVIFGTTPEIPFGTDEDRIAAETKATGTKHAGSLASEPHVPNCGCPECAAMLKSIDVELADTPECPDTDGTPCKCTSCGSVDLDGPRKVNAAGMVQHTYKCRACGALTKVGLPN